MPKHGADPMKSLKGHLLIASSSLEGSFFGRTVILMLEHGEDGALGLVLNRPTEATVGDISEQVLGEPIEWDKPLLLGGPVPGPLMVLHTDSDLADDRILARVFRSVEAGKVQALIRDREEPSLIVTNYSGWGPGQLEGEFGDDSWLTLPARADHVFWDDERDLWAVVVREAGTLRLVDWLGLREVPPDPNLN